MGDNFFNKGEVRTFRTNVSRELGLDHTEAENQAMRIALSMPSTYFKLRSDLLKLVVKAHVEEIYKTVWFALSEGVGKDGTTPLMNIKDLKAEFKLGGSTDEGNRIRPMLPEAEINTIALSIASGFKQLMEQQLCDRVLPKNLHEIAVSKTAVNTRNRLAEGNGDV